MYQDILRESWVYQGILREGLEEGREQVGDDVKKD